MFEKIVVIEPVNLVPAAKERLHDYAKEVVFYDTLPKDDQEIIQRIGDADGALISYTSRMGREAVTGCPNLRYVGMCCSLYEEKSANVDIAAAREKGITVRGVRDYGDNGVIEFVISELVRYLLDAAGYGSVARLEGIFTCSYTDRATIPAGELGYAALAQGLGLISGTYNGAAAATRGQAAAMLCRLMER